MLFPPGELIAGKGVCIVFRFILDAVADLRDTLRAAGSDLIVRIGKPEEVVCLPTSFKT